MTFSESIIEFANDRGQITWDMASSVAGAHGLLIEFIYEYGSTITEGIDAGEFLVWMGY
jgi:hypothetical protein